MLVSILLLSLSFLSPTLDAVDAKASRSADPEDEVLDLGGDDAAERVCPELAVTPEAFFNDYQLAVDKLGVDRIPYFSCGADCQGLTGPQKQRNLDLWTLVGAPHAGPLFYGKASPAGFHELANALLDADAKAEWPRLAGLDCNGFTHRFAEQNGWAWAGVNLDPPKYASKPHIQTTRDICPGDFIVYEGVRHVAVVGERTGQEVINGVQLDTFKVYESVSDGTPKGLQVNIQGFDLTGREHFKLHHSHQPSRTRSNAVVVVPGSGTL